MTEKPPLKAWGLLILLSLIWGSSFILIKRGLVGLTAMEVGSLRIVFASLILLPFAFRNWHHVQKPQIKYLIASGFIASLFPSLLFAIAQTRIESSIAGVLNALTPIFTILVGLFIYKQKQSPRVFIGVFVGFIGTAILVTAGSGGSISQFNFYALFVVVATLCYAINVNLIKYHLQGLRSMAITSISLAFVGPVALVQLAGFTDFFSRIGTVDGTLLAAFYILILGIMGTAVAYLIFNKIVSLTDPVFTTSVTYFIPIVSVLWGLWDGEVLSLTHALGILGILIGVYIANSLRSKAALKPKKKASPVLP